MKKKLIAMLLACSMLASLAACGSQTTPVDTSDTSDTSALSDEQSEKTAQPLCKGAPEDSGSMLSVVSALIMSMTENDLPYDPEDPAAFWTELAYLIGLDGDQNPYARRSGAGKLVLPASEVQKYAAAMFAAYDRKEDLPEMPRDDMMLRYLEEKDKYVLQPGDFGTSETRITHCQDEGKGVYTLQADFVDAETDEVISTWEVVMAKDKEASADSMYHYRVADIRCLTNNSATSEKHTTPAKNHASEEEETITLDDAVNILYEIGADKMNLDRSLDDCFVSPNGETASVEGHTCYVIHVYEDVSQENLLGSYYVRTDGQGAYAYNNVTEEYNLTS